MINNYSFDPSKYSTQNIVIDNLPPDAVRVLDVGCNEGYIGKYSNINSDFYGIDFNEDALENAKKHYKKVACINLNTDTSVPWGEKFDCIVFGDVLEHLIFPEKVLRNILNRLDSGGLVIVSLPNIAHIVIRFSLLTGRFNYTNSGILDKTHLHFYTLSSAENLLLEAGLKIIKVRGGASKLGWIINVFPFLMTFLATSFVFVCKKK